MILKMSAAFRSLQQSSSNGCSELNELLWPYCMQFGHSTGADFVEVGGDIIKLNF